jgi:hypothetical protein
MKYTVSDLSAIPAEFHGFYAESNGKYVLQVDGAVPKAELDSLRDANIGIKRQIEAMTTHYDGVDPDEFRRLLRQERLQRDWQMFQDGRGDEVISDRTALMRAEHQRVLDALTTERDAAVVQVEAMVIDTAILEASLKAEVRPCAIDDVLLRGRQTFRVADGRPVGYQGDAPLLGRHGAPLGVAEWVASLSQSAPHMFEASASGAAPGGSQQRTGQGSTIRRAAFDKLDPWGRADAARTLKIID